MDYLIQYLYTGLFVPEKVLMITEQEIQETIKNLKKTGIDLTQ